VRPSLFYFIRRFLIDTLNFIAMIRRARPTSGPFSTARMMRPAHRIRGRSPRLLSLVGPPELLIRLRHHDRHVPYINVTMPHAVFELTSQHLALVKPSDLLPSVQALQGCEHLSVYHAWTALSKVFWPRDEHAPKSVLKLLEEYEQEDAHYALTSPSRMV
jgi:hypothetical protein